MSERQQDFAGRMSLGFAREAEEAFRFLSDYGFRLHDRDVTILRYASERVFVNVYHGRSSYEIGLEIALVSPTDDEAAGYSLSELVRLKSPEEAERFRSFTATTPNEVKVGVQELAKQLVAYGGQALKGDPQVFETLAQQRRAWSSTFAADVAYRQVSPRAAEAFRQHDYRKAAELHESIEGKLTKAELKKLEYAKKHK
jgi:hypothetical protein